MIKRFCDICGAETERSVTNSATRLEAFVRAPHSARSTGSDFGVQFSVIAGIGKGCSNSGDLCAGCLIDAIAAQDTRPKDGGLTEALDYERRKFRDETMTTSFLAGRLAADDPRCDAEDCNRFGEVVYVSGTDRLWLCPLHIQNRPVS